MRRLLTRFLKDKDASATLEYVILFLPLIALVFTSFQIAMAYHFALTAQKAVENGARLAAVRDPVFGPNLLPDRNARASFATTGAECASRINGVSPCVPPAGSPWVCRFEDLDGANCDRDAFEEIFNEVSRLAYLLEPENMMITYRYAELGMANGPFIPLIEVTILERPFFLQFGFSLTFENGGNGPDAEVQVLPAATATAIGEDLSSTN